MTVRHDPSNETARTLPDEGEREEAGEKSARAARGEGEGEREGSPLFDEVLKFHPPGLAAVRLGNQAWHIDPAGDPAYSARFRRTFGFYEGLAAVIAEDGWHHIHPDGSPHTASRYAWCGNYQNGRCAVRDLANHYFHLDPSGLAAYPERWRYAGDYRDGIAVIQGDDGRSTHIDGSGKRLHDRWFLDLDVFHKGVARARDQGGWMHITPHGQPCYARRFAAVEPFYNGQARVEGFDGALLIIDETGQTLVQLREPQQSEFAALSSDLVGFWKTQTIAAGVALGIFDALPATAAEVATQCGLPEPGAVRLLGALAELGLTASETTGWRLTARGELLGKDHPLTLADAAIEYARFLAPGWEHLPALVRGEQQADPGAKLFAAVAADPSRRITHHRMLRSYARHDYPQVVSALGLRGDEQVLDAAGGTGTLAQLILERHPDLQVLVLDHPEVAAQVPVSAYDGRLDARGFDLFAPWPAVAEVILLARVLHDWDDQRAQEILFHARAACRAGGRLLIIERLRDAEHYGASLCDLHLWAVTGGRERTCDEFARLLDGAGFKLTAVRATGALPHVLEARPA